MQTFDPLPVTTPVNEFDDYVAGYRYYSSISAHIALQDVAHRLASVNLKEADVVLYTPRILFIFRELKQDLYVNALIEDTLKSLEEDVDVATSPITAEFIGVFTHIMIAATVKLKEIHAAALSMSEVKDEVSSDLIPWEQGGEHDYVDVPPFSALDDV